MTDPKKPIAELAQEAGVQSEQGHVRLVVGGVQGPSSPDTSTRLRVALVDDSPNYRLQLRTLLEVEGLRVVGEAANGWEAIDLFEQVSPHVMIMDQNMPSLSGIDATRRILRQNPGARVIFLAAEEAWRDAAMSAGAEAYFVKDEDPSKLLYAIRNPIVAHKPEEKDTDSDSKQRGRWVIPFIGSLIGVVMLAVWAADPTTITPGLGLVAGLISMLYGVR